ncbi:N-formylglutamate amidohydrolase [Litorimonas sp. RW-G-Af-16]|uniref:N-formylglutamate amidohydrolase n=1 Tax=Litorimonas sp. RW-G-Af-16 TaxID=3241168 RepID=UPI003AAB8122
MTAYTTIAATTDVPLFIFGDHASCHIPREYNNLGLSGDDLTRHIAWDIGTETIIRQLCAHFGCGGQLANISRLVIDYNRDPDAAGLIPEMSDGMIIPSNQKLTAAERQNRIERFHVPYHEALSKAVRRDDNPLVISLHSFTPQPITGEVRPTDIGLLVRHDVPTAEAFRDTVQRNSPQLNVGMNLPYSAYDLNYTVDRHIAPLRLRHLAIELRQDHISCEASAHAMGDMLAKRLTALI